MINLEEFLIVSPTNRNGKVFAFSVMMDGTFRINGQLCAKVFPGYLRIRVHPSTGQILLQSSDIKTADTYSVPKSGIVKAPELYSLIKKCKITIPSRYIVHWDESFDMWMGEYNPHYIFPKQTLKNKLHKPRKKDLSDMLPERSA